MRTLYTLCVLFVSALAACPPGWVAPTDGDGHRCFRFETSGLSWYSARAMCKSARGELLSLRTQAEKDWIHEEVLGYTTRQVAPVWHWWAGINAINQPQDWVWSDGAVIDGSLIHWAPNEPNMASASEKCGELHRDGFNDNTCTTGFPYICAREADIPREPCPFGQVLSGRTCIPFVEPTTPPAPTSAPRQTDGPEPQQGVCAQGWVESPDVPSLCFRFETVAASWAQARQACKNAMGSLVAFTTQAEKTWVEGQVRRLGKAHSSWWFGSSRPAYPNWWTGLHRLKIGFPWKWDDESAVLDGLLSWQSGRPKNTGWENCGELHITGYNDKDCDTTLPYICTKPKTPGAPGVAVSTPAPNTPTPRPTRPIEGVTVGAEPQQGACPDGWTESVPVCDRCYRFETTMRLTWEDAQRVCQSARGDLVSLRTKAEQAWVYSQMKRVRASTWGGLHRQTVNASWSWPEETHTDIWWQPGEPNNAFERCGEMHRWGMNDNSCWRKFGFVCSRPKDVLPEPAECPFGEVLKGRKCEPFQLPTPLPPTQGTCADGWVESPVTSSRCYRFVHEGQSFEDAKKMCRVAHGDLITVKGEAEKTWLITEALNFARSKGTPMWLVGLKKDGNSWTWTDGSIMDAAAQSTLLSTTRYSSDCVCVTPDGLSKTNCYSNQQYVCARDKVLVATAGTHLCGWGERWVKTKCETYQLHQNGAFEAKMAYIRSSKTASARVSTNNLDISRIEDELKVLEGRHVREMAELRSDFTGKVSNLTARVRTLEAILKQRASAPRHQTRPTREFDASLTVIVTHVPQTPNEVTDDVARSLLSQGLGLLNVEITHARRMGGSPQHPGTLKIQFSTAAGRQMALGKKDDLRSVVGYRNVRMRAAHTRGSNARNKSVSP